MPTLSAKGFNICVAVLVVALVYARWTQEFTKRKREKATNSLKEAKLMIDEAIANRECSYMCVHTYDNMMCVHVYIYICTHDMGYTV